MQCHFERFVCLSRFHTTLPNLDVFCEQNNSYAYNSCGKSNYLIGVLSYTYINQTHN